MLTTVDLPPAIHRRVGELAAQRAMSQSAMVAELVSLGLAQLDDSERFDVDSVSGLPAISLGRRVTDADVAAMLDDD